MRVGTNHGSLSDRIMNRFGDTPLGMVESALEFLRICQKNDYPDVILSMKASNPKVMIQAYRLLVARMDEIGMTFPRLEEHTSELQSRQYLACRLLLEKKKRSNQKT